MDKLVKGVWKQRPLKRYSSVKYWRDSIKQALRKKKITLATSYFNYYKDAGGKLPFTAFYQGKRKVK